MKSLLHLLAVLMVSISAGRLAAADALFIVSAVPPNAADMIIQERIEAAGFNVEVVAAAASTAGHATGKELVFISESISSGQVNLKFRDVPVGVVVLESFVFDDMLMVAGAENTDSGFGLGGGATSAINIVNPDHPLAAGFPSGELAVMDGEAQTVWGNPTSDAILVATLAGPNPANQPETRGAIFAYEKGAPMAGLTAPGRRVGLFIHGAAVPLLNQAGLSLLDAAIQWARSNPADLPPKIENLSPADRALFHPSTTPITFRVTTASPNAIPPQNVKLTLNGQDVSAQLTVTGTHTEPTVAFSGLQAETVYFGTVSVTDSQDREATQDFEFDTLAANSLMIEAEDYNYFSGQFQDNPPPTGEDENGNYIVGGLGYVDTFGTPAVDFYDTTDFAGNIANHMYRSFDPVGTQRASDEVRQKYLDASVAPPSPVFDYHLSFMAAGEWLNYTRTFPGGSFQVYLRVSSAAAREVTLEEVTSNRSEPNQSTRLLGTFRVSNTGAKYRFVPLTDALGQPAPISLSGVRTLRMTAVSADNTLHPNFLLLAPLPGQTPPPFVKFARPVPGSVEVPVNSPLEIEIANRDTRVVVGSVRLFLDAVDVTASASVQATADGARLTATPVLMPGFAHRIRVTFDDNAVPAQSHAEEWSFTTTSDVSGPVLLSAGTLDDFNIGLIFDEPLDPVSAVQAGNYRVNGATPAEARAGEDGATVILTLNSAAGASFTVTASNVRDRLGNVIAANSQVTGVPAEETPVDIGDVSVPGTAVSYGNGHFDLEASGSALGATSAGLGTPDGFSFLPTQQSGDFDLRVRVARLDPINRLSKAGIIARETLDADARTIALVVTPRGPTADGQSTGIGDNDYQALIRAEAGGQITLWPGSNTSREVPYPSAWLRLTRERSTAGDVFTAYRGNDGVTWTQFAQATVSPPLPETLHVGVGATPTNNAENRTATALFRGFGPTPAAPPSEVQLSAAISAGQFVISWPEAAAGFQLQSAGQVNGPWTNVTAPPVSQGDLHNVNLPISGTAAFFRLFKQTQ